MAKMPELVVKIQPGFVGLQLIAQERERQIDALDGEGYTAAHDDEYRGAELLRAASCYVEAARMLELGSCIAVVSQANRARAAWPWHSAEFKPDADPIRNLEKAGALIAAEIDRLARARGCGPIQVFTHRAIPHARARTSQWVNGCARVRAP
ncbi:MAG TPA: hypothetical protein VKB47_08640 [Terracidiphilus sp.]|nr:hypothetical protein [Terracidiphilus sp.]